MSNENQAPSPAQAGARAMSGAEWAMLGLLSLFWGGSFLFNGIAVKEVPVFTIVAFRVLLGALALHVMLRVSGIPLPLDRRSLAAYFGMAILNGALPFCLIVFGQTRIASGLASILNATTPIFTMLLAHFALAGERLDLRRRIGVLLGFAGVVVLFSGRSTSGGELPGLLACIGAAISYSLSNIFGRLFIQGRTHPTALATGQLSFAALIMVPVSLMIDHPLSLPMPSGQAVLALLLLALVSTAAAYTLFFRILTRAGATNVSLVTLLIPCSGILLGVVFLGEALAWQELLGFAVIASGLLVIDGRIIRLLRG